MSTVAAAIPTIQISRHARMRLTERFRGQEQAICEVVEAEICEGRLRPARGQRWYVDGVVARELVRTIVAVDSTGRYSIVTWYKVS